VVAGTDAKELDEDPIGEGLGAAEEEDPIFPEALEELLPIVHMAGPE
jgi:hypothetical protein